MRKHIILLLMIIFSCQEPFNIDHENTVSMIIFFRYALVEIILVVIGILIALQINNWNEHRKERIKELELLSLLILDLNLNKKENDNDLHHGEIWFEQGNTILEFWKKNKDIDKDNLYDVFTRMSGDHWFFSEVSPTYIRVSNSPLWDKFPETLSHKVNDVLHNGFTTIKKSFEKHSEYSTFYKLNYLVPNNLADEEDINLIKKTIMKNPDKFIGHLRLYLSSLGRLNRVFGKAIESIEELVADLEKYKNNISGNIE